MSRVLRTTWNFLRQSAPILTELDTGKTLHKQITSCHRLFYNISRRVFLGRGQLPTGFSSRNYGRYEPDYLDPKGIQIAKYDFVNLQLTGYDYTVLEEFQKFVHNSAERFGLEVEDAWGTPSKHLKITRLKPESTVVESEYKLQLFERTVQLSYPESTTLPLFIDIVHSSLPAGVTLKVQPHFQEHTEVRYVPDLALKELKAQLEDHGGSGKKKKTKGF